MSSLSLVTASTAEPFSLEEAKMQCKAPIDLTDEDPWFDRAIKAVRGRAETVTGRQLLHATWALKLDDWPCDGFIEVPHPPLSSVTSITYVDAAGTTQTLATDQYIVDAPAGPTARRGRIAPAYGVTWPTVLGRMNAITVTYVAGYGADGASLPEDLRSGMLLLLTSLHENRSASAEKSIDEIVRSITRGFWRPFLSLPETRQAA